MNVRVRTVKGLFKALGMDVDKFKGLVMKGKANRVVTINGIPFRQFNIENKAPEEQFFQITQLEVGKDASFSVTVYEKSIKIHHFFTGKTETVTDIKRIFH